MNFAPGGTNFPHHHDREEEIYLVLDGDGDMVAGGGTDGVEGRHPAKAGDAYFFRLNCTVGFYGTAGAPKARILAVRSLYPSREEVAMSRISRRKLLQGAAGAAAAASLRRTGAAQARRG